MKITSNIFDTLRDEFFYEKYDHLLLSDRPNQSQLNSIKRGLKVLNKNFLLSENTFFTFARSEKDIPVESTFNILFSANNPGDFCDTNAKLKFISINRAKISNTLYKGYSGICLFEFEGRKPEMLERLEVFGKKSSSKYEMLFLSQRPVLNRVLELLN